MNVYIHTMHTHMMLRYLVIMKPSDADVHNLMMAAFICMCVCMCVYVCVYVCVYTLCME